jgi:ABC-type anion transport system duplicated permease subunit
MKPPKPEELHTIVSEGRFSRAITILGRLDPTVAADAVMSLPYEEQQALFRRLPVAFAARLTAVFPYYHAYVLLHALSHDDMIAVLQKMNPIERTNFIDELPEQTWQQITKEIDAKLPLVLAAVWTIPVGVLIGLKPRLAAIAQPIAQIAASVPAPALFPIVLLLLIRMGGGLGIASILLLLLGTQWYIFFNVIAGASAIPSDLKKVCEVSHLSRVQRWRKLFLPAIFPYLVTGFVTASGGAWNASIIAEYFRFRCQTFSITGLGAIISRATDAGNFPVLLAATIAISAMVVTINRLLWRRQYILASTKFKLEFT